MPIVSIGGQAYLDFALDINQVGSGALLSLDEVQISLASSGTIQGYTSNGTYGGQASLIYDMGGSSSTWVKLNANIAPGSGGTDMFMDIPLADLPDSAFSGANRTLPLSSTQYVYLYSHFGTQNLNPGDTIGSANDGFEEWAAPTLGSATSSTSTTIYDAATILPVASPAPAGVSVVDSATVTGTTRVPTGDVTFLFYNSIDGTGTPVGAGTVTLNASGVANYSNVEGPLTPGSYSFVAHYNGDTNFLPSYSAPEPLIVQAAQPTLTTTPFPSSVTLSNSTPPILTDSATLTGGFSPTGSITFTLYAPGGGVVDTETATVNGNGTYTTPTGYTLPTTGAVTGTYQWVASYGGDPNNNPVATTSGDEPVTVDPATLTITTTQDPTGILLSNTTPPILTDSATLAGGYHETGAITFTLYAPGGGSVDTESVTVNGNGTYTTPTGYTLPTTGAVTGTYQWVASYGGDPNNKPVATNNGNEPVVVDPANLTISTSTNPSSVTLSNLTPPILTDSATLAGGYHETGTITFTLYAPGGGSVDTETATVNGNGTYTTPTGYTLPTTGAVAGTYQWVASYGGDPNNNPSTSNRGDEPVTVSPATPTISTTTDPTSVTVGTLPFNDTATLATGFNPTGTITFTLYAPGGSLVYTDHVTVSGNGSYSTTTGDLPGGYVPTLAGTYQWVATYGGDPNNNAATTTSGDEPVIATTQSSFLTTSANPSDATLNSLGSPTLLDTATLTGGFSPTGSITFTLYAPGGGSVDSETVTVNGNGNYTTPTGYTLPTTGAVTGTYQWVASYSGDPNNNPSTSTLGDEPVAVDPATLTISTTTNPSSVTLSNSTPPILTDSATLAGGYHETGAITFTL